MVFFTPGKDAIIDKILDVFVPLKRYSLVNLSVHFIWSVNKDQVSFFSKCFLNLALPLWISPSLLYLGQYMRGNNDSKLFQFLGVMSMICIQMLFNLTFVFKVQGAEQAAILGLVLLLYLNAKLPP